MTDTLDGLRPAVRNRPLTTFTLLTFAFSWGTWGVAAVTSTGRPPRAALVPGAFGPPLAALAVVAASERDLRSWLAARLRWRVAGRWYAIALAVPLALAGLVSAAVVLAGGSLDPSVLPRRLAAFPLLLLLTALLGGGQEELGWRGFAQPRFEERFDPPTASVLVGALWACWHLPLFWLGAPRNGTGSFVLYAVLVVGFAVVLGWLYDRAAGSVLPAVLLHAGVNTSGSVVPATVGTLEAFPLVIDVAGVTGMAVLALAVLGWEHRQSSNGVDSAEVPARSDRETAGDGSVDGGD